MTTSIFASLKKGLKVGKYPTADKNASFVRLLLNAVPYLVCKDGSSLPPLSVFIHVNNKCNLKCKMSWHLFVFT